MELIFQDFLFAQILINNQLCNIKAFWLKSKLSMDVDYPFKQKCSRCVSYFSLNVWNVVWVYHEIHFFSFHVFIYCLWKFRYVLWIFNRNFINISHFFHLFFMVICNSFFEQIIDSFSMIIWVSFLCRLYIFENLFT